MFPRRLDVAEPFGGEGQAGEVGLVEHGFEGAAVGVAADDDMADVEDFDGVFDGGGDAAGHGAVGRANVARGAAEEHVARLGLEDEVGDDAGVSTGDEEDVGLLQFGEKVELVLHAGEDFAAEFSVTVEEALHWV